MKIVLVNHVEKQNIIIAKHTITREVISTGKIENYKIVSIYELNEEGKIIHVTDYL